VEAAGEPGNWCFYTHLIPGEGEWPAALHFSHSGNYLLLTHQGQAQWHHTRIGRQGDGLDFMATVDKRGRPHVLFHPRRYNGDITPLLWASPQRSPTGAWHREVVDTSLSNDDYALTTTPDGEPVAVHLRRGLGRPSELVVSRRTAAGWVATVLPAEGMTGQFTVACDRQSRLWISRVHTDGRRLSVASGQGTAWQTELVWEDAPAAGEERALEAFALVDGQDQPVIVLVCRSREQGWLRVFRRANHE
jgi:hypothetical protein